MRKLTASFILLAVILLAGCSQQLTYERWQTVNDGMSADAVKATLGKPWQTNQQTWVYYDEDRGVTVMVYFDDHEVTGTTWQDPEHGMQGRSPHVKQPGESEEIKVQTIR